MNGFERYSRCLTWSVLLLLVALAAGCGSGGSGGGEERDPILGGDVVDDADDGDDDDDGDGDDDPAPIAPTVTAVAPVNNATGVAVNTKIITAAFSTAMDPATLTAASFTLECPAGTPVSGGDVTYEEADDVATLTLPAAPDLPEDTICTGTITTAAADTEGTPLAGDFEWTFTTGVTPDTTRPRVTLTVPDDGAADVVSNTKVTATFTEDMDPATLSETSFTLAGPGATAVDGTVTYSVAGRTATFAPDSDLPADTLMTATVTTAAEDLAGNALAGNQAPLPAASDFVWTFTTDAAAETDTTAPTVTLLSPADLDTGVCLQTSVNATFSEDMDPATLSTATFTVQESGPPLGGALAGTVTYDAASRVATFTSTGDLSASTDYTATVTTGVEDLAGNALASNEVWTFTTGTQACSPVPPIALGAAAPFGGFGGSAGMTNEGIDTVINGDIGTTGASTLMTGFHDLSVAYSPPPTAMGCTYTETTLNIGVVNGTIFTAPPPPTVDCPDEGTAVTEAVATQALSDAQDAFNNLSPASLPGGTDPGAGQLGGLTLAPGIYQAAGGSFQITGSDLTLDAQGDANAVWVFQTASTLTVGAPGAPRSIILINGAQAKNVFWQVGSAATINEAGGGTMVGTIISSASTTFSTSGNAAIVTLNGRALALNASVTMVNTVINVPAP